MAQFKIDTFTLGMWMTNSYLISSDDGRCAVVDAGFEPQPLIAHLEEKGLEPEILVFTHAHLDHIAGAKALKSRYPNLKTAVHEAEADFLTDPALNLSTSAGMMVKTDPADSLLKDGDTLDLAGFAFEVLHTPGHSPGGICLYNREQDVLFSGDTLFQGSVGRYDFPTSDGQKLMDSINSKLLPLPEITRIYPGHGAASRIGEEKRSNPFLSAGS